MSDVDTASLACCVQSKVCPEWNPCPFLLAQSRLTTAPSAFSNSLGLVLAVSALNTIFGSSNTSFSKCFLQVLICCRRVPAMSYFNVFLQRRAAIWPDNVER
ncbi:hypothetical protein RRG08_021252 [Elysia crispata]|uniref:Uncharacterized protein n=1 Tax=Elysia crispata TaxID=231223 RepID=A0AAE0YYC1_9GAST|nr:hypothetical protein RRG08_021252 [Elysia crispata]